MARLLGPDANSRLVYAVSRGVLASAAGQTATVYSDAAGTTLANIATYVSATPSTPGSVISGSTLTVNSDSMLPLFWFPDGVDTVYVQVDGGTVTAINADLDARLDAVATHIAATTSVHGIANTALLETVTGAAAQIAAHAVASDPHGDRAIAAAALASHEADTTAVHGIADTSALETTAGATAKVAAHAVASDPHADRAYTDTVAAGKANTSHAHATTDITSGTLGVVRGGTGVASVTSGSYLKGAGTSPLVERTTAEVLSDIGAAASAHTHTIRKTITLGDDRPVLTTGAGTMRWYNREGATLTIVGAWASAGVQPTGADLIVDINANGSTIFSTQANRPTITAASNGGAISATPNTTSLASGDYLTVDIDQVGATIAGGQLAVGIVVTYAG